MIKKPGLLSRPTVSRAEDNFFFSGWVWLGSSVNVTSPFDPDNKNDVGYPIYQTWHSHLPNLALYHHDDRLVQGRKGSEYVPEITTILCAKDCGKSALKSGRF